MKPILEKIEVDKRDEKRHFFYTGYVTELDDTWLQIDTTRGETLKFRKEQVVERKVVKEGSQ